jgi:hypothetical protein
MVRKQFYITKEQDEKLKRVAAFLGITEAEVVRRGIELAVTDEVVRKEAWKRLKAFFEERRKIVVPQGPRTWTRDELYDDED